MMRMKKLLFPAYFIRLVGTNTPVNVVCVLSNPLRTQVSLPVTVANVA